MRRIGCFLLFLAALCNNSEAAYDPRLARSSTDNAVVRYDGTVGVQQNSAVTVDDSGNVAGASLDTGQGANELYDMDQDVLTTSTPTFASVTVNTEVYDASGWNGDLTAPTKDAVRDKIEALSSNVWQTTSNVANLVTSTDNVTIGSATSLGKWGVDGDTDEIQARIQGHSTQTADTFVVEKSDGTDCFSVNENGTITASCSATPTQGTADLGTAGVRMATDGDGQICYTGLGNGSDEDVCYNLDDTSNEITVSTTTGATLFNLSGALDLKITGDDLFMTTNTSGATLVADGTNFNPVVVSGEATIATNGAVTLADSVTVTGWVMGASTATTPAANDNDTSLATTAFVQTELTAVGAGTQYHYFRPEEAQFLATNFPQLIKNLGTNFPVSGLAYDGGSTNEQAFWKFTADNYGSGNLTLTIFWYADTASTEDVQWGAQIAVITPNTDSQDVETDALATATETQDTHLGTTGQRVHSIDLTISNLDSIAAGDIVFLNIYRDASDTTNDDMSGDAILLYARLSYARE